MKKLLLKLIVAIFGFSVGFSSPKSILQDRVGAATLPLFDQKRERPVQVELWYPLIEEKELDLHPLQDYWIYPQECRDAYFPEELGKRPLIIFSHGFMGDRRDRSWFAERLVQKGYIVASVEHHGGSWQITHPQLASRIWDRPLDVSFVLDTLLHDPLWGHHIDETKIGFSGYSLGGVTGLLLSGAKILAKEDYKNVLRELFATTEFPEKLVAAILKDLCYPDEKLSYYDPRISCYYLMAPSCLGVEPKSLPQITKPFEIISLEKDPVLAELEPASYSGSSFFSLIKNARISHLAEGASHYIFINEATPLGEQELPSKLYQEEGVDRKEIHNQVAEIGLNFFESSFSF